MEQLYTTILYNHRIINRYKKQMRRLNLPFHASFAIILLLPLCLAFHNPGILFQIPTPYILPTPLVPLPQQIPSILLQKLELTDINLRQIRYSWKYETDKFVILLQKTLISFHWVYGKDQGVGTFDQQYSDLVVGCVFGVDGQGRFKVDIESAKITNQDKRHSIKISLGGNIPETIVVQVTNLILNHAKSAFRAAIKSAISSIVQDFTKPLRQDIKLICRQTKQNTEHCIYLNTTLVGKPLWSQNIQIIQINGAPYLDKHQSGYLDPTSVMFKINSKDINIQLHQELITKIAQLYNQIQPIDITIKSTEISSVCDIDSQTLAVVFPKMRDFGNPRPVLLQITIQSIQALMTSPPFLTFVANGTLKVQTQQQQPIPYIKNSTGQAKLSLAPITNKNQIGIRIQKIEIMNLSFNPEDIKQGFINPSQITKHLETLMQWASGGVNGGLNEKKQMLQFAGVEVEVKVGVVKGISVEVGLVFGKSMQNAGQDNQQQIMME